MELDFERLEVADGNRQSDVSVETPHMRTNVRRGATALWLCVTVLVVAGCATVTATKGDRIALVQGRVLAYSLAGAGAPTVVFEAGMGDTEEVWVVADLRGLLESAGLKPPYVLVGHSLGGLYRQYFARRYPDEVAALVLVESTHWDQQARKENAANIAMLLRIMYIMLNLVHTRQ